MKKVFVAMSGGVDSSVAAALLKEAAKPKDFQKIFGRAIPKGFSGFDVVGVFMKQWAAGESDLDCFWKEEREFALRAAAQIDVPLLTWDFSKEYRKHVADYMVKGYKEGITPNPDIMCNKIIKFGLFLDKALELGADYIATGHYARKSGKKLLKAKDPDKDQSYFLYSLTQEQLKHCIFPVGDYKKDEVRKMAKKFGLPNWSKPDSQGVCFVGPLKVDRFLKSRIKPKKGIVLDKNSGKVLGEHDGAWFYTIGQRHGFNLSAGKPFYVVGKDVKKNILYVDEKFNNEDLEIRIKDFNWISGHKKLPLDCKAKTRYRQKDLDSVILKNGGTVAQVKIIAKNMPVTPGQAAVFYKGNQILGGGIIV